MGNTTESGSGRQRRGDLVKPGGVVISVIVILWSVIAPPPQGFTPEMQSVLAVFAFSIVLWLSKAIPYVTSSTLSVVLLSALGGVETFQDAAIGFASSLVFFLLLLLLLGQAISKVNLDVWFASRLLSAGRRSPRPVRALSGYLLALSFIMPSAVARAATFIPVVRQMSEAYGVGHDSDFERTSFLVLGHINPIASMALMTGGGMAIITSEIVQNEIRSITWVEWAVLMIPPVVVLYLLSAFTAERFYDARSEVKDATVGGADQSKFADGLAADSDFEFTRDQRTVALVMICAVALWVIGSFSGMPTIIPAALAVGVLSLPNVGIITTSDVTEVSWGIMFVIGTMFSILDAMEATGTLNYVVNLITSVIPFGILVYWQVVAVLLALAVLIRVVFSTASAAIIVVLPIILQFGERLGVNRLYLALSVLLIVGSTTILPFNTTSVLLSFDRGPLSNTDVIAFGLVTMVYAAFVIVFAWSVYWPLIT